MAPAWSHLRAGWRARVEVGHLPGELDTSVRELEANIQWHRIMQAELAAGLVRPPTTPLPPPLAEDCVPEVGMQPDGVETEPEPPPPGVPRAALRVLLLLREMGVGSYEPGVALQLLEVMHAYAADVLTDAQILARTRQRGDVSWP